MSQYRETVAEIDAWFDTAQKDTIAFAAKINAPVIGYAWRHDHGKGCGYFRTDQGAKFSSGTNCRELPPDTHGLKRQAEKLRRMIAQMQKRGVRAEIYEVM